MSDFGSLLFYVIMFFISTLFYNIYTKYNKRFFLYISFAIPMFIGGLRYNVGTDYMNYVYFYNQGTYLNFGFMVIMSISKILGSFRWMFFIYNFFTLLFFYKGLDVIEKKYRGFSLFLFLFIIFTVTFNGIRQMLAVSIVFFSYKYIINNKPVKWTVSVIIANLFHSTAILCLPLYFIAKSKNKIVKLLSVVIIFFISIYYLNIIEYLSSFSYFSHFLIYTEEYELEFGNYSFYLELLILLYLIINRKKMILNNEHNYIYMYIFLTGTILTLTGFYSPFVKRIALYFSCSKILLLPQIPSLYNYSYKRRIIDYMIIISYAIVSFIIMAYILKQGKIIPYIFYGG